VRRSGLHLYEPAGNSLAYSRGQAAKAVSKPVGKHAPRATFIDVMEGGDHGNFGMQNPEQAGRHIGMETMAVQQVRAKGAKETSGLCDPCQDAGRGSIHSQADDFKACRPFRLRSQAGRKNNQRHRVAAAGHPVSQRHSLPLGPANAERCKDISNLHAGFIRNPFAGLMIPLNRESPAPAGKWYRFPQIQIILVRKIYLDLYNTDSTKENHGRRYTTHVQRLWAGLYLHRCGSGVFFGTRVLNSKALQALPSGKEE
jgi:hypothetical protein